MKKILSLGVSVVILSGAYFATFGVPGALTDLAGTPSEAASAPQSGAGGAQQDANGSPNGGAPAGVTGGAGTGGAGTGGGARGGGGRGGDRSTTVVLTPLEQVPYEDNLRAIGSATAMRSVDVVSEGAGKVTAVFLPANGRVEEGDVLLELDDRIEALNVVAAQAALDQATETVTRYERLRSGGSSTVTDVTLSDARLAQRLAEAELGLAQIALEDLTIRAPISGRLGLSDIDVGDVISANSVITTIDETDALLVEFELPERAIAMLDRESTILASTPALRGKVFEGEITSYDSRIDSVTRSITVRAQIDNADEQLWPGMTFSVRLLHESDPLPMVPSTAITWSRAGSSIWVNDAGKAKSVPVTILYRVDQQVWIQADLPEGAMIVSEGAQKLREGAAIVDAGAKPSGGRPAQEAADATPARDPA